MARQTTNYGLTKPDYTDIADIEVVNSNMDIIDEALKVIDTKSNNVMSKNSSAWSSTVTYAVGQYCIYNNSLWKCLVQHSGQTPQEGTYWARVSLDTLGSEINALNSNKADIPTYDDIASYGGGIYSSDASFTMGKNGTALIQVANWTDDTLENISVKINTHSVATMTPSTRYKRENLTVPVRNGDAINFSGMSVGTLISINLM